MRAAFKYLIVGGGMAASAAVDGIRDCDRVGTIGLLSAERDPPYDRPPLTKGLWRGERFDRIWRRTMYKGVDLRLGVEVIGIDVAHREVVDVERNRYGYERLLLATGGTPRQLPAAENNVIYFRTLADYRRLREIADRGGSIVVIGGGFIGSELAAALAMNGCRVTLIFPGSGIADRMLPRALSQSLVAYYRERGVDVLDHQNVEGLLRERDGVLVYAGRHRIVANLAVAGLGIEPNVGLARAAGLGVDDGIAVDHCLRTREPTIFAAGDVANFFCRAIDRRVRVEHEDNAVNMGMVAGRNMAGAETRYVHLPFFYSDLFDIGYEAVGVIDNRLEMVADWAEPNRKGVVYYLERGQPRGVLLWNARGRLDAARRLIESREVYSAATLRGRISLDATDRGRAEQNQHADDLH